MSEKDDDTKERLLAGALELLESDGFDALTIRNIANRGGVAVSVVHYHYVNKQGLLDALKLRYYRGIGEIVNRIGREAASHPVETVIDSAVRTLLGYVRSNVAVARLLASEVLASGQLIDPLLGWHNRPHSRLAAAVLGPKLGIDEKTLRFNLQAITVLVTRFAVSSDVELASILGDVALDEVADRLVDLAMLLLGLPHKG